MKKNTAQSESESQKYKTKKRLTTLLQDIKNSCKPNTPYTLNDIIQTLQEQNPKRYTNPIAFSYYIAGRRLENTLENLVKHNYLKKENKDKTSTYTLIG